MGTEAELKDGHNSYTMANSAMCTFGRVANVDYCLMPSKSLLLTDKFGQIMAVQAGRAGPRMSGQGQD